MSVRRVYAVALLLAAVNLRLGIAAVPPVLGQVRATVGLTSAGGGVLTAIPVLCFGVLALLAPWCIRRWGLSVTLGLVLGAVVAASGLRSVLGGVGLFTGTVLLGGAIAVGNVLVPAVIKRDFSASRATMTALYSAALSLGGGLSAGLTVPLERLTGWSWEAAVAVWGVPAVVALAGWTVAVRRCRSDAAGAAAAEEPMPDAVAAVAAELEDPHVGRLWRDRLAWCVTLFMGLQSLGFYSTLSWIPTLLEGHGVAAATAGWLLSFATIPGLIAALVTPGIERRIRRPAALVWLAAGSIAVAYLGLLVAPASGAYLWMALLGTGQGMSLALGLGYIVARSGSGTQAAHLSTMAQGVGYTIAAAGPFLLGALHGLTGGWTVPFVLLLVLLVPLVGVGTVASRPGVVLERRPAPGGGEVPPAGIEPASRA